jgi:phenylalanyl-tRNA synthetase beta chain
VPTIDVPVSLLWQSVGTKLPPGELADALKRLGCDVEGEVELAIHRCPACRESFELRASEEPPRECPSCGKEPAASGGWFTEPGTTAIRVDLLPVRPDLFDPGGMGRALRTFLGLQEVPVEYEAGAPSLKVQVEASVSDKGSYRPWIGCAAVRSVVFTEDTLRSIMKLQENLHWGVGRDRRLASIGVYDLARVAGDVVYRARRPEEIRFAPLGWDEAVDASVILGRHPKGTAFAHLLEGMQRYPLLLDSDEQVLSMPPIINGDSTKVTLGTTELFVDVTGTAPRPVEFALQVFVTSLHELLPGSTLEAVTITDPDGGERVTPDLGRRSFPLDPSLPARILGVEIAADDVPGHLRRMGHTVRARDGGFVVGVPAYRNDIMHPQDLAEDVGISYGYDRIVPAILPTDLAAQPLRVEELSRIGHETFRGLGLLEVMTSSLLSRRRAFTMLGQDLDEGTVLVENPATEDQEVLRCSLIPGLLGSLAANVGRELPQRIYEIGDVSFLHDTAETGAVERRFAAAAILGPKVGFADVRSIARALLREYGWDMVVRPLQKPFLLEGRAASVGIPDSDRCLGVFGELHPEVLERHHLHHPAVVLEIDLESLFPAET